MNYIEKNLLPDEQIKYRTKKHFIIFLSPLIITVAVLYLYTLDNPFLYGISWLFNIIVLIAWGYEALVYFTSEYVVTNKRLMMKEGFFFRRSNEMRLSVITRVDVGQSIVGQFLNYGNVIIHGFGDSVDIFSLIAHPFDFQKSVQTEMDKTS